LTACWTDRATGVTEASTNLGFLAEAKKGGRSFLSRRINDQALHVTSASALDTHPSAAIKGWETAIKSESAPPARLIAVAQMKDVFSENHWRQ
jgi:hypothetical protein